MLRGLNRALSYSVFSGLLAVTCVTISGCGKSASSVGSGHAKLFATADPQTKEHWDTASAALKTNGFFAGTVSLMKLQQQTNLTPEQVKAVDETLTALSDQMYAAANKGDANAVQAIKDLQKIRARR
jgi:hypothetical protein